MPSGDIDFFFLLIYCFTRVVYTFLREHVVRVKSQIIFRKIITIFYTITADKLSWRPFNPPRISIVFNQGARMYALHLRCRYWIINTRSHYTRDVLARVYVFIKTIPKKKKTKNTRKKERKKRTRYITIYSCPAKINKLTVRRAWRKNV